MGDFTIENFWKPRFSALQQQQLSLLKGWSIPATALNTFKEAPLTLRAR